MRSYTEVRSSGGTLLGAGHAAGIATGGARLDASIVGALRLPGARIAGQCGAAPCPDPEGRTLLAHGNATLAGLAPDPADPQRLRAQVAGSFAEAAYDEAPVAALKVPTAVVVAGAALGLLALLVGLFARSARPPPLTHPRRQQLFDLVQREPGLSFRALQRRLGWPTGPLQAHVARLVETRILVAQPYRNTVRYFENHGRYRDSWLEVTALRDPDARRLHGWLLAHPDAAQHETVQVARGWGWTRAKALRRLTGLEEAGLLARRRVGRTIHYAPKAAQAG
jgi:hypothetical protein